MSPDSSSPIPAAPAPGESSPGDAQEVVERLARRIVRMQLAPAAIFFIESVRPLNFVGSQLMHFLAPFIHAFGEYPDYDKLATLLEDRRSVDMLLEAIEKEEEGGKREAP